MMAAPLHESFSDAFDPSVSLQLNNRYWPGQKWTLRSLLADCEAALREGGPAAAVTGLRRLRQYFTTDAVFARLLHRVHRLHSQRSQFGFEAGRIDVSPEVLEANRYRGSLRSAEYAMARPESFSEVEQKATYIYRREYGTDVLRVNRSVRFAMPNDRTCDVTSWGELSDFHNDEYKGISAIIYFSPTKTENGAFSFIEGSELIPRSIVLTAIHQCVELDMGLRGPENLSRLPLEFRGSMAVGNYLDYDKVRVLCAFRRVVEGGAGTYVTFNGQYVLHRGGKPLSGSRIAGFLQPEGMLMLKAKGLRSLLFAHWQQLNHRRAKVA
jgi:hypothetical protein